MQAVSFYPRDPCRGGCIKNVGAWGVRGWIAASWKLTAESQGGLGGGCALFLFVEAGSWEADWVLLGEVAHTLRLAVRFQEPALQHDARHSCDATRIQKREANCFPISLLAVCLLFSCRDTQKITGTRERTILGGCAYLDVHRVAPSCTVTCANSE